MTGPSGGRAAHWDAVYTRVADTEVSWFTPQPTCSLELFDAAGLTPDQPVLDVGAGASRLVDALLARGFSDVTALDVSDDGLARSRARLGAAATAVHWVATDLLGWAPPRRYAVWHDRAVFHFLTEPGDRARYRAVLDAALRPGGHVVVGAFAADGPQQCSGLPTARYGAAALADALGAGLDVVAERREEHCTPWGAVQPFTWLVLRSHGDDVDDRGGRTVTEHEDGST